MIGLPSRPHAYLVAALLVLLVVVLARRLVLVLGPRRIEPRLGEGEPDALVSGQSTEMGRWWDVSTKNKT